MCEDQEMETSCDVCNDEFVMRGIEVKCAPDEEGFDSKTLFFNTKICSLCHHVTCETCCNNIEYIHDHSACMEHLRLTNHFVYSQYVREN